MPKCYQMILIRFYYTLLYSSLRPIDGHRYLTVANEKCIDFPPLIDGHRYLSVAKDNRIDFLPFIAAYNCLAYNSYSHAFAILSAVSRE